MFDWIPLEIYTPIYNYVILLIVLFIFLLSQRFSFEADKNLGSIKIICFLSLSFVILYMGLRPVSGKYFIDMGTYNRQLMNYRQDLRKPLEERDPLFQVFIYTCSKIMSNTGFFLTCIIIYIVPTWLAVKKWFKGGAFYAILFIITSFSFWAYGVNGIRNGMATSIFIFALSRSKIQYQILWMLIAINTHNSMYLPFLAFLLAYFVTKPKYFLMFWFFCIPFSLVAGGFFQTFFATMFEDDRSSYLTNDVDEKQFSNTGFRWDFLLYSASAVYAGWYYIYKRNFKDRTYEVIYCTYLFANSFWILVIEANFSNRFAYLSWFLMPIVIVYPLLRTYIIPNQYKALGYILLAYYGFTFFMNQIFYKL